MAISILLYTTVYYCILLYTTVYYCILLYTTVYYCTGKNKAKKHLTIRDNMQTSYSN